MDSQAQLGDGRQAPGRPAPGQGIRASDAERERTVEQLNQHAAEGRLTTEEFSERVETALTARTRSELEVLLADLPAPPPPPAPAAGRRPAWPGWIPPRLPIVVAVLAAIAVVAGLATGWGAWPGPPFPFFPLFPLLFWGLLLTAWMRSGSRR